MIPTIPFAMSGDPLTLRPRAVLFDMDGTLTEPMLDFPRIKSEMGIGTDRSILEALAEMKPIERARAEEVLHRHEETAAGNSTLNPGCREVLDWLDANGVRVALITRNSATSVKTVVERHGLRIDLTLSRADARPKPNPQSLHDACRRFEVRESEAWMVGDGQYDVEAGNAAGVATVWLSHDREKSFSAMPWQVVRDLGELLRMLQSCRPQPTTPQRV